MLSIVLWLAQLQLPENELNKQSQQDYRVSVTYGAVQANLTYRRVGTGFLEVDRYRYLNPRLQITRENRVVLDGDLPVNSAIDQPILSSLQIRELNDVVEPEVILDLNSAPNLTGCCTASLIFSYTGQDYTITRQDWGAVGYRLRDFSFDGSPEFVSADSRFSQISGLREPPRDATLGRNLVDSVLPLQIWQYRENGFTEVTRNYPNEVRGHAFALWNYYRSRLNAGDTFVRTDPQMKAYWAAYLADKALLGEQQSGLQVVQQAYQGRDRTEFLARLQRLLNELGYR